MSESDPIESVMIELLEKRGLDKSCCPSEVARLLSNEWRPLMSEVNVIARKLAKDGRIRITQKGQEVEPDSLKGPYRIRLLE
ncbi:MAG: DUF3253 domain-containing protein [Verrucomicrobiota bacterium]